MSNLDFNVGFVPNEVYQPRLVGNGGSCYKLWDTDGNKVGTLGINTSVRKQAGMNGEAIQAYITKTGKKTYRRVPMDVFENYTSAPLHTTSAEPEPVTADEVPTDHDEVVNFIHNDSLSLRPAQLKISDLKWKILIRSAVRGKNILMTGSQGSGKTMAAKALVKALDRPDFYFNLGATQDPRATLIGNTHFNPGEGTYFDQSLFVKAISTPNAVILLDEVTRAHPDAHNILMTVLDYGQRYLRLDEADGSPTIKVADGVTFIGTANIGNQFTGTRVLDRAFLDRFTPIEMELLNEADEFDLLKMLFPNVEHDFLKAIASTAHWTRTQWKDEASDISEMISTRSSVEWAELIYDGFTFMEAAELHILNVFSNDGHPDSERTKVIQYLQQFSFDSTPDTVESELEIGTMDEDDELIF